MSEGQVLTEEKIGQIIEAALLAAEGPLTVENLFKLFADGELAEENGRKQIRDVLAALEEACGDRGVELIHVASGFRYQAKQELSAWVSRLWEEKPPRYTRALLETLALVAYKQPVTRGDIEQIRGVGVSQNIMRTLLERDWIRVVGQREAPGRPSLYGTTKTFLDYFNLNNLDQLPPLEEIRALIEPTLVAEQQAEGANAEGEGQHESAEGDVEHAEALADSSADEPSLDADDETTAEADGEAESVNANETEQQDVGDAETAEADAPQSTHPESSTQSEQN
ncbi:MAG: SMC-Scp complex subunit ScpB [Gammaproteobacteria bacterium]|jgi:segregation and condensation protein B|nr:SMC-Scp complex subunit ScpB [Gammaproteobacteria bacterium]MBT5333654.1 SMC-Scp complex subunit ScpB [Gammaproteobacteria bacterium]MBT5682123.1 SMC-Scp complex subunit ScpB [Gammaproteobacteria bacterium]MBT6024639.1 SMC-Scp complex subunit ScpB [Gammaproteobacteria bacterium]MBT6558312.1 SMC-Scp complex subunit ScpB [Gammaproteobacteria bacterium]